MIKIFDFFFFFKDFFERKKNQQKFPNGWDYLYCPLLILNRLIGICLLANRIIKRSRERKRENWREKKLVWKNFFLNLIFSSKKTAKLFENSNIKMQYQSTSWILKSQIKFRSLWEQVERESREEYLVFDWNIQKIATIIVNIFFFLI